MRGNGLEEMGVQGLGCRVRAYGSYALQGCRSLGFRVWILTLGVGLGVSLGCWMCSLGFRVSQSGGTLVLKAPAAGALNRMIPPPLALHPRLSLYGFKACLRSCLLVCFLHLFRPGGCKVWAGSGSSPLVFFI